ncbi:MAG: RNA polymerase sigma factor [Planctomycetota bacterium]|jgi:RNA polymerase sigma-70 factor (ECF subfamily)
MDSGRTASRFRTTSWTLIVHARASQGDLEELLRRYWSPVYAFLRRSGRRPEEAEDLTQAFLSDVLLRRDLIGRADPDRGRFRSFLVAALRRYVIDHQRQAQREGVAPRRFVPENLDELKAAEPRAAHDPSTAFDRQWAAAVIDEALRRTEESCWHEGMERQWRAFEARVRRPLVHGCEPTPIELLLKELPARGPQEIYDMIYTVKRKLRAMIRDVVAETVEDPEGVDHEVGELRRHLSLEPGGPTT